MKQTAQELAEVAVPELADVAAVDVLDTVLSLQGATQTDGPALFRALALVADRPTEAVRAADPPGELATYAADRLVTQCVHTGQSVLVQHVTERDLPRIARCPDAAALLARAGVHSYLAVPLIARGEVIGVLDLKRARNPLPFGQDDVVLAGELAARAAVGIDNARWFQSVRNTAVTLQRSLLPDQPPRLTGLEVASRYRPAYAASEVGGDWFDTIALGDGSTVLVVGDVMGSGIDAAATMGRLAPPPAPSPTWTSTPRRCSSTSTRPPAASSSTSRPASTPCTTPTAASVTCPTPDICRPPWCATAGPRSCSACPPAHRSASAVSRSSAPPSTSTPVTCSSSTPTV